MRCILSFIGFNILLFSCSLDEDTKKVEHASFKKANEFAVRQMFDSAIYYTKKALELNDSITYLSNIGVYYNLQNIPQEAIIYLDSALRKDSSIAAIYASRSISYKLLGLKEKAIKDLEKALRLNPDNSEAKENLCDLYFETDQYESVVGCATEILITEPHDMKFRYIRGKAFLRLGNYEKAIIDYDDMLVQDPSNIIVLVDKSYALAGLKKFDLAINILKKAIEINPEKQSTAYRNLAEIYLKVKKDKDKACEYIHLDAKVHNKETSKGDLQKYCGK